MEQGNQKKWKKVLYEDQNVPDNYVDETFMNELRKNLNIKTYDYWALVRESGIVMQQVCSICIFSVVFVFMADEFISPNALFLMTMSTSSLGYIINKMFFHTCFAPRIERIGTFFNCNVTEDFVTVCIFLGFGFCLSTVLMTLTQTISTDTIYTMTILMFLTNLLFHDYGSKAAIVSQPVSLNSAIFASVCLASRLPTERHSFSVITFAFEMFALWPIFRANVKSFLSAKVFVGLTIVLTVISFVGIFSASRVAASIFVFVHMFVTFICPALLVNMQSYKNNIHGPWEEAVIRP